MLNTYKIQALLTIVCLFFTCIVALATAEPILKMLNRSANDYQLVFHASKKK